MNRKFPALLAGAAFFAAPAFAQTGSYTGNFTPLYSFAGGAGGSQPNAPLTPDSFGNLYGTTGSGGIACDTYQSGCGTIFKLDPSGTLTILYEFVGQSSGYIPSLGLTLIRKTLFGSTTGGGSTPPYYGGPGVLYSINTDGSNFTILHHFTGGDGKYVITPLLAAPAGGLYGSTEFGGVADKGVTFLYENTGDLIVLHSFTGGADGGQPHTLLQDPSGNLFGATWEGGITTGTCGRYGCGVIYEITRQPRQFKVIYTFTGQTDCASPLLGSIASNGTIYGSTFGRCSAGANGIVFSLTPVNGAWQFAEIAPLDTTLGSDYAEPGPVPGPNNSLIGTTAGAIYDIVNGRFYHQTIGDMTGPLNVAPDGTAYGTCGAYICGTNGTIFRYAVTKTPD